MITFMDSKEKSEEVDRCLDPQLWHACAGGMVQMPRVNTKVYYFPQGHAEHACEPVNFRNCPKFPPLVPCRVDSIKYMADPETDEVYAKIRLVPLNGNDAGCDSDVVGGNGNDIINGCETQEKPLSFAKTLTQSDANNGGGFSVPRYCAETIFPRLDFSADPPVQNILVKDVHGETWKFRHIYRGTPRRHLLTTGWSSFVNHKKLVAGDSIVFLRAENGDLCVGIRRAKKGGSEPERGGSSGWNPEDPYGNRILRNSNNSNVLNPSENMLGTVKVRAEAVIEAANLAANKEPFEVAYYPRGSTPEFCVKTSLVESAMQIRWCSGMRFKMAFETEDSSRISWFMGIVSSVQVADPLLWPNSPWRLLQVTWDEPDLLQNVTRVSPWLVELVANIPPINLSPFLPARKKMRLSQHPDFPFDGHIPVPTFPLGPRSPFGCLPESTPAGMQGARHAHYGLTLSDHHHLNKVHSGLFPAGFPLLNHSAAPPSVSSYLISQKSGMTSENVSCLLSMAGSTKSSNSKKQDDEKRPQLVLFGKTISPSSRFGGHYEVLMESEDVGQTIDLSLHV
ncbi:auxin response factor 18-like [Lotus japonicus]|uniref:auxin response factor 18-like n=1 Tax=Lotus japonicus TaxID=34305 RepID=UPI00258B8ECE|nr:auxin response factor 18-like [Lotus japonicus]